MRTEVQREYGGALWLLACDEDCADALLADVRALQDVLAGEGDYLRLICAPNILLDERLRLLDEAFRGKVHAYMLNFMKLLAERGHFAFLPDCLSEFCRRYDKANNIENVTVVSAVPLTKEQKAAIGQKLSQRLEKNVRLTAKVDPSLIGGIRIETENTALDGSVRQRIDAIRQTLHQSIL